MAVVYATGFIKGKRWARTLAVVAQASPRCAAAVRVAIQAALRGDPAKAPRDEGALVELLTELLADVDGTIDDAEAWAYLQASRHAKRVAPFATPGR
jgi:O-succinylbenzoate synthase